MTGTFGSLSTVSIDPPETMSLDSDMDSDSDVSLRDEDFSLPEEDEENFSLPEEDEVRGGLQLLCHFIYLYPDRTIRSRTIRPNWPPEG